VEISRRASTWGQAGGNVPRSGHVGGSPAWSPPVSSSPRGCPAARAPSAWQSDNRAFTGRRGANFSEQVAPTIIYSNEPVPFYAATA
jgi:hypothetical protein